MLNLKTQKLKNTNGITLVALVITIIILLILAGISISALTNQGLFGRAKEAKERTENAQKQEQDMLSQYETELNQYDKNTIAYKVNNGEIKIGDYVSYTPDTLNNTDLENLKTNLNTYSGNNQSTVNPNIQRNNLNWRVLDVKDGQVRLISATPTTSKMELKGYNGYNNAVKLLDDACSTLYNSKLATKVQNLKIEDIQNKMKTDYTTINSNYGNRFTLSNKYYPSILTKEKGQKVTVGQNTTTETELDLSEQKTFENQTESKLADTLDVKFTYWYKIMSVNDFDGENKEMYYKLFINNGSNYNTYWMSSRCVNAHSSNTNFNVRYVDSGNIGAFGLYDSNVIEGSGGCAFRPIVTLNSNVQVTSGDGSINSQYNIQ